MGTSLALALSACSSTQNLEISNSSATENQNSAATEQSEALGSPVISGKKLLIMPLDVELSLLTASGLQEPNAEWTANAIKHMRKSISNTLKQSGNSAEFYNRMIDDPYHDLIQLEKLHEATGYSILVHDYGQSKLPSRADKAGQWSLGTSAKTLAQHSGADYALFVFVRDSYSSGGRAALMILGAVAGVGIQGGTQFGFASLVDLKTGDIKWFNRLFSAGGDLREAEPAEKTMKNLLEGLPIS